MTFCLLPVLLAAQTSLLRVRAIDNDGAARAAGSRSAGLAVEVTDGSGQSVPGAVVTVRLPDDGPSGAFANGLSSAILTAGADGRVSTSPITWNRLAGTAEIRITAVSGRLRAGTIASCRLSEAAPEPEKPAAAPEAERHGARVIVKQHASGGGSHLKWILIGAVAAGATAAALGLRHGGSASSATSGSGNGTGPVTSITAVGPPLVGPHP